MNDKPHRRSVHGTTVENRPRGASVAPENGGWVVRRAHSPGKTGIYSTQEQAIRAAQELLRSEGGTLAVRSQSGQIRETVTIGRKAIAKINAVEGLRLTDEMQREFREFDGRKLTDEERRAAIIAKYGSGSR